MSDQKLPVQLRTIRMEAVESGDDAAVWRTGPGLAVATIDALVAQFDADSAPRLASLRRSAVHNDLNDNNVLVAGDGPLHARHERISGILDFGDMVFGYTVADLAVACAYVMLGGWNPERGPAWPHHHPKFDFDERCLDLGVELGLRIIESAAGRPLT